MSKSINNIPNIIKQNNNCSFTFNENYDTTKRINKFLYKITTVKKQFNEDDTEQDDTDIDTYITSINDYTRYYSPVISRKPVVIGKYNNNNIDKCKLLNTDTDNDDNQLKVISETTRYVGELNIIEQIINDRQKSTLYGIRTLLFINDSVLDSINKLQKLKNPIIHCKLQANNILIDNDIGIPIIINFNNSVFLNNIFDNTNLFKYIYKINYKDINDNYSISLELYLLSYIVHNVINVSLSKPFQSRDINKTIGEYGILELMNICIYFLRTNIYLFSQQTYHTSFKSNANTPSKYTEFINNLNNFKNSYEEVHIKDILLNEIYNYYENIKLFIISFKEKTWGELIFVLTSTWRKWDIYSLYNSLFIATYKSFIESNNKLKTTDIKWLSKYFIMLRNVLISVPSINTSSSLIVNKNTYYDETCIDTLKNQLIKLMVIKKNEINFI